MGVPGLVAWFIKNYKKKSIMVDNINDIINSHLYIDTNCLIHPQAKLICDQNKNLISNNIELLEKKIIIQITNYIKLLIDSINPTKLIYIAIDGVAPMAKIKHQRLRRFKTIYDIKEKQKIADKYNVKLDDVWYTAAITPGSQFMDKLNNYLLYWINMSNYNIKVIYSSCYTPGEGEHKILQHIKMIKNEISENIVIYGLDTDLIFLSLAVEYNNIYLMREIEEYNIYEQKFNYLSISKLKDTIINNVLILNKNIKWNNDRLINDFVFLCFFCGNDFIPNIPSLTLKPFNYKIINGLDSIISIYNNIINDNTTYLINIIENKIHINIDMFLMILEELSNLEQSYYSDYYRTRTIDKCINDNKYINALYNYDNNIFTNYKDIINLGDPNKPYKEQKIDYYKYYYNIDISISNKSLDNILDEYIHGLVWTLNYYYDKCKNYEWYFKYHHGPFISDLYIYIKNNMNIIKYYENLYNTNSIWYENEIKPVEQLLLVLPKECENLLPLNYRKIIHKNKLNKYFPENITVDYLYKRKAWQNILMLEIIPPRVIKKLTKKLNDKKNIIFGEYEFKN